MTFDLKTSRTVQTKTKADEKFNFEISFQKLREAAAAKR